MPIHISAYVIQPIPPMTSLILFIFLWKHKNIYTFCFFHFSSCLVFIIHIKYFIYLHNLLFLKFHLLSIFDIFFFNLICLSDFILTFIFIIIKQKVTCNVSIHFIIPLEAMQHPIKMKFYRTTRVFWVNKDESVDANQSSIQDQNTVSNSHSIFILRSQSKLHVLVKFIHLRFHIEVLHTLYFHFIFNCLQMSLHYHRIRHAQKTTSTYHLMSIYSGKNTLIPSHNHWPLKLINSHTHSVIRSCQSQPLQFTLLAKYKPSIHWPSLSNTVQSKAFMCSSISYLYRGYFSCNDYMPLFLKR